MTTTFIPGNNINTTLAAAALSSATTLTLASSANLPTLAAGQQMPLTLNDAATGQIYEVVYVTAISGASLTVLRGQEGTAAQNWNVGDFAFCAPTSGTVAQINGNPNQQFQVAPATQSQHAVQVAQLFGGLKGIARWAGAGTYSWTVPANVTTVYASGAAPGGGGGSGGSGTIAASPAIAAGGGGGGAGQPIIRQAYTVVPGSTVTITIGTPGSGGAQVASGNGNQGGSAGNIVISGSGFNGGTPVTLTGGNGGGGGSAVQTSGGGGAPPGLVLRMVGSETTRRQTTRLVAVAPALLAHLAVAAVPHAQPHPAASAEGMPTASGRAVVEVPAYIAPTPEMAAPAAVVLRAL